MLLLRSLSFKVNTDETRRFGLLEKGRHMAFKILTWCYILLSLVKVECRAAVQISSMRLWIVEFYQLFSVRGLFPLLYHALIFLHILCGVQHLVCLSGPYEALSAHTRRHFLNTKASQNPLISDVFSKSKGTPSVLSLMRLVSQEAMLSLWITHIIWRN